MNFTRTQIRNGLNSTFVTVFTLAILVIFLAPFAFMVFTSLKTQDQISIVGAPIWPAQPSETEHNGKTIETFTVPVSTCAGFDAGDSSTRSLGLVKKGRQESTFMDPSDPGRG